MDLSCAKGVFAEPGWSSYGQKRVPCLEALRSFTWWRKVGLSSRLKVYLAWFLQSYLLSKTPRLQRHWKSSVSGRSEADDKTTKSDNRQRSQGCTACTWPSHGAHFAHLHSVSSTLWETFFVVACPYQIKRNCLSSFWKKKLVWLCEWAIIFTCMSCLVVVGTFSQRRFVKCIQW